MRILLKDSRAIGRMTIVVVLVAIIVVSGIGAYLYFEMTKPKYKSILVIGMNADLAIFDPHRATGLRQMGIMRLVCETLTDVDQTTGEVIPVLAESWQATGDWTKWTFRLRKGVKFHDGTPFNAQAVKYSFDRILDPETKAPTRSRYASAIKSVEVTEEYTVVFNTYTYPAFPALLNYPPGGMISPTQGKKLGLDFYKEPIGTGAYKFVKHIRGDHIKLIANEEYWGGSPKIKEILARPIVETAARVMALESGQVDYVLNLPPHEANRLKANPKIKLVEGWQTRNCFISMNTAYGPFKDKRVRHALNYAVDKKAIIDKIFMGTVPIMDSWLPPTTPGYQKSQPYEYNPTKAKQLLAEAGYPDGFEVTLHYGKGNIILDTEMVEAVQSYLGAVGIRVKIVEMDYATYSTYRSKNVTQSPLQLSLGGNTVGLFMDPVSGMEHMRSDMWPPAGLVPSFWKNQAFDSLHNQMRIEIDLGKRVEACKEAQKIIYEDAPVIFLLYLPSIDASSAKLHGVGVRHDETIILPPIARIEP